MGKTLTIQNCTNCEVKEQTKIGECLLPSGSQPCVVQFLSKSMNIKIHAAITFSLYGCKTWYLTLRKKHRLRIINNSLLKKIFGPKREEVRRDWRKLYDEEPRDVYSSSSIILVVTQMSRAGHTAHVGEIKNSVMGKPDDKHYLEGVSVERRAI